MHKLIKLQDKELIKIVTGIRRCGKSTLLTLFQEYLRKNAVAQNQIIAINFEDPDFDFLLDYKKLYEHIKTRLIPDKKNYIFLDEIQNVPEFQKALDGLYIKKNVDLYITGSNAYLLSGEIATLLSGRFVEIALLPLSFKEYAQAHDGDSNLTGLYQQYLLHSSFPYVLQLNNDPELIRDYLSGIYSTVVLKDVVARKKISDVAMLGDIIRFMFDNISNLVSIKKISDTMTSNGRKISTHTVEQYLSGLTDSYILYKAGRYNIKGKQYLKTLEKYYLVDIGLRYFLLGSRKPDYGHILENVVYLELIRRSYKVYVGKIDALEVDFVCTKGDSIEYYQVSQSVIEPQTLQRELASLKKIPDNNPKFLLTLDAVPTVWHDGIKQMNALEWLLQ